MIKDSRKARDIVEVLLESFGPSSRTEWNDLAAHMDAGDIVDIEGIISNDVKTTLARVFDLLGLVKCSTGYYTDSPVLGSLLQPNDGDDGDDSSSDYGPTLPISLPPPEPTPSFSLTQSEKKRRWDQVRNKKPAVSSSTPSMDREEWMTSISNYATQSSVSALTNRKFVMKGTGSSEAWTKKPKKA